MRVAVLVVLVVSLSAVAAPKCLSVSEAAAAAGPVAPMGDKLTPPLPVSWPPSGAAAVRYFDFHTEPLPTGIVSYSLQSPSTEFTVPLDGSAPKKRALKRIKLGTFQPPVDPKKLDLEAASAVLLEVVCENRMPTELEAVTLREGYGAWFASDVQRRGWVAGQTGTFVRWISLPPVPPPAPPGAKLTARIDGDGVILNRDGKEVRFERAGLKASQLTVVPLRADGAEPALWINVTDPQLGAQGLLVRFANPPQLIHTLGYSSSQRGISSTSRTAWLLDLDGDGFNDIIEHATTYSDVGPQPDGAQVFRYDAFLGNYVPDEALEKKAPVQLDRDTRPEKSISKALGVPRVELRGRLDLFSVVQPAAPAPDSIGGGGSPPFVGPDVIYRVMVQQPGQKLGGHYHLAHVRYGKEPKLVSTLDLGPLGFPMDACEKGRTEEYRREGNAFLVVWPINNFTLVEQRVPWDGKGLVLTQKPPVQVARCGL